MGEEEKKIINKYILFNNFDMDAKTSMEIRKRFSIFMFFILLRV